MGARALGGLSLVLPLVFTAGCGSPTADAAQSVLLITFDTTRADVLSPYGGPESVTPNWKRFAAEGLVFENASSVAPLTLPSHASMLTGLYPPRHGLRENGIASLPSSAQTLAESAQSAGFQTAAFVAAVVLDASFGLDQGFDTYVSPGRSEKERNSHGAELRADVIVDSALAWVNARDKEQPFFLWVHLFDPHSPYDPPPPFRPKGQTDGPALYLGEVGFADAQLGRLLDTLRADGTLDQTFVALTADHGEAFGEHKEPTHGAYVWETTLHVPLILRDPGGLRAGERVADIVGVTDLYPSLMSAMGLPLTPSQSASIDGVDLLPLFKGGSLDPERGVYFESYSGLLSFGWSHLAGWRDAGGKYIHSSSPQFFTPATDPRETRDLLADESIEPGRLNVYQRALAELGERPVLAWEEDLEADAQLLSDIRGLGYMGAGGDASEFPKPLATSDLPAPQDNADVYQDCLRAQELTNRGQFDASAEILTGVLRKQPNNAFALDRLSTALIRLGQPERALPLLERLLEVGPGWSGSYCNLGLVYGHLGRIDEAVEQLQKALAVDPSEAFFWDALLKLLEENERHAELAEWRQQRAQFMGEPESGGHKPGAVGNTGN